MSASKPSKAKSKPEKPQPIVAVTIHLTDKTTGLGDFVGPVFFELAPVEKASRQSFFRDLALVASLIALAMVISFAEPRTTFACSPFLLGGTT